MQSNPQSDLRQAAQSGERNPAQQKQPMQDSGQNSQVQGEGDYASNRRYTESVKDFVESGKVGEAARNAKPDSQQEAADMRRAEQEGASHAKGNPSSSGGKKSQQA